MKIKLFILALLFTSTSVLYAGNHENKGGEDHKNIHQGLNLSEDQKIKFDAIMQNHKESLRIARDNIQANTEAELSKFLSVEQMELLETRKKKRAKMKKKAMKRQNKRKNKRKNKRQERREDRQHN